MKIRPVGAELFHEDREIDGNTDGRTDMTEVIVAFRCLSNVPKTPTNLCFNCRR
jgi:hypothetical protein